MNCLNFFNLIKIKKNDSLLDYLSITCIYCHNLKKPRLASPFSELSFKIVCELFKSFRARVRNSNLGSKQKWSRMQIFSNLLVSSSWRHHRGQCKDCTDIISKTRKRGTDDFIGLNKVHWEVTSSGRFFGSSRCYMYK